MIKIKRVYEAWEASDGDRALIDKALAKGVKRDAAQTDLWLKKIAPSSSLRHWFQHGRGKWTEFKKKYHQELNQNKGIIEDLLQKPRPLTLLYSAKHEKHNNAVAFQEYLFKLMGER